MKVLHICLCGPYSDDMSYQENELVQQHFELGHQVLVIANIETYDQRQILSETVPGRAQLRSGVPIVRLPFRRIGPQSVHRRLRAYQGLMAELEQFGPEVILFHGLCAWAMLEVAAYVRRHPQARFYADSHEDFNNSARTLASKWLLHFLFYRRVFHSSLDTITKVLCVSKETESFVTDFYGAPREKIEFFPLGGSLWKDDDYEYTRSKIRSEMAWDNAVRVFIQSGKLDRTKGLVESLRAFSKLSCPHLLFIVVGRIMPDVSEEVETLAARDSRICLLGWQSPDRLRKLLVAADLYVQPGSQSATMQMALCCRKAVILNDVPSHRVFVEGNGWLISESSSLDSIFAAAARLSVRELASMSERSAQVAAEFLDYREQAIRLLKPA